MGCLLKITSRRNKIGVMMISCDLSSTLLYISLGKSEVNRERQAIFTTFTILRPLRYLSQITLAVLVLPLTVYVDLEYILIYTTCIPCRNLNCDPKTGLLPLPTPAIHSISFDPIPQVAIPLYIQIFLYSSSNLFYVYKYHYDLVI
jgi:hypothetical protein